LEKRNGRLSIEWLKRLRQRSKISFSKDRFDTKLSELENRTQSLHRIRKHIEHTKPVAEETLGSTSCPIDFHLVHAASARLHEALTTFWRCETRSEHFANICLDDEANEHPFQNRRIHFNLAWTCPGLGQPSECMKGPLRLLVEADSAVGIPSPSPASAAQEVLVTGLKMAIGPENVDMASNVTSQPLRTLASSPEALPQIPDLSGVPNLCRFLGRKSVDRASVHGIGYLQKTKTFKHIIYAPQGHAAHANGVSSLEDALIAARKDSDGIPLLEKLNIAKNLSQAVLRYHSTPWLNRNWRSQDIVFFGVQDSLQDPLRVPSIRAHVPIYTKMRSGKAVNQEVEVLQGPMDINGPNLRSPIRNQTLFSLGVMLIELAYNSPLSELQVPDDDQGDPHTLYWTAVRLGDGLFRKLGPVYGGAVKICLNGVHGASSDLDDPRVQGLFFQEVIQKLKKMSAAVSIQEKLGLIMLESRGSLVGDF